MHLDLKCLQNDACGMDYFDQLPEDLVLEIFSYLSLHTVRCVLPLVCRSWNHIIYTPRLWERLTLSLDVNKNTCVRNVSAFRIFLQNTPQVQNIHCSAVFKTSLGILSIVPDCGVVLRKLSIPRLTAELVGIISNLYTLEVLSLQELTRSIRFSPLINLKLKELIVDECSSGALSGFLACCAGLEKITLEDPQDDAFVNKSLLSLQQVKELDICTENMSVIAIEHISKLPKLKRFTAHDEKPSVEKLKAMSRLPLTKLSLSEPFYSPVLSSSALASFFATSELQHLVQLTLKDCRINDEGALHIRTNCPMLNYIDLEKKTPDSDEDVLTKTGILHFFHLLHLRHLEITTVNEHDWAYRRVRWGNHHVCDSRRPCPVGLDALLTDWDEISLNVDDI